MARHLATRGFRKHMFPGQHRLNGSPPRYKEFLKRICQSKNQDLLATSPQAVFEYRWLKDIQFELARYVARGSFKFQFQMNLDRMARQLATRDFRIHIFPGKHKLNGSPHRYKGFLKMICQRKTQDRPATSPQAFFEYQWLKNSWFELAHYVNTGSFKVYMVKIKSD